jgi:signal transduction histidine kinase
VYRWRIIRIAARLDAESEARVTERTRIAQDFHDTLLQGILSASMLLHVADKQVPEQSPAKPLVARCLGLVRKLIEDGRNAVQDLRVSEVESDDLTQALSQIPRELAIQRAVNFRVTVLGQTRLLHPTIRDEVYRILREALSNAFRHSEATSIEIELQYSNRRLRVLVRDNGCGVDERVLRFGREGHWGLTGMRERAIRIGSRLKLWSRVPGGTEVELSVPGHIAFRSSSKRSPSWLHSSFGGRKERSPACERRQ